jgi:cell wall-associated NlpC family hydrolase
MLDKWWGWSDGTGIRPAHVVCSSLAQWVYARLGLPCPAVKNAELTTPSDWWSFNAGITA